MAKRFKQFMPWSAAARPFATLSSTPVKPVLRMLTRKRSSAEDFLREMQTAPEWIVADPPRAGLGKEITTELLRLKPSRLTIVSCDPTTLARDLKVLQAGGYRVGRIALVDLFPQTYHFETVVRLEI